MFSSDSFPLTPNLVAIGIVIAEMFLVCHATSRDHMFDSLCELWVEAPHGKSPTYHVWLCK